MIRNASVVTAVHAMALAMALALFPACLAGKRPPHPLYPNPEQPRSAGKLALLYGSVRDVDGKDVSRLGQTFSLLPGCHLVRLGDMGEVNGSGAFVANLDGAMFALRMQAGHTYAIDIQTQWLNGSSARLTMQTIERDGSGAEVARIPPVTSRAQLADCQQWQP